MPEHMLFHFVFLCQVLLISFYYPRRILKRMRYVFDTYPPSTYPKLYPRPIEYYEKARRNYRIMNLCVLVAGLLTLAVLLGYSRRSGKWDHVIAMWFFLVQFIPVMLLDLSSLKESRLMRNADPRTTRKAELHPRHLFDFVSPAMIGVATITYIAFVLLVLYIRQFDFPWFGGYWNIVGVTIVNLCFAGIIFRYMYGKKLNPHQAYEDRMSQIETIVTILVFVSIAATLFIALNVVLAALELRDLQPIVQSLYFQLLAVICFRAYRIDYKNYDVYKEDPLVT